MRGPVTDATDANDTTDELRAYAEHEIAFISRSVAKAAGIIHARARSQVTDDPLRNCQGDRAAFPRDRVNMSAFKMD